MKRTITIIPDLEKEHGLKTANKKRYFFVEHLEQINQPNESDTENDLEETSIEKKDEIKLVTSKETARKIKSNNPKNAPGYNLITGGVLKKLLRKAIVKPTNLINTSFILKHVPIAVTSWMTERWT